MTVLNLHGYNGNPKNSAYSELIKLGYEVISPFLDYDNRSVNEITQEMEIRIRDNNVDIIVGTSLGGFFASLLAVKTKLPVFLISPCLMPFVVLPSLGYKGSVLEFENHFSEITMLDTDKVYTIVGLKDEIIGDHSTTKALIGNANYIEIPDGMHSGATLPLYDFFNKWL